MSRGGDKRGKDQAPNKTREELLQIVDSHIRSFNPSISHYRRAHAPNRLYISPEYSAQKMFEDFKKNNPDTPVKYLLYWSRLKAMNISFVKLGEEECEVCVIHSNHLLEDHGLKKKDQSIVEEDGRSRTIYLPECDACKKFSTHIDFAKEARTAYRRDHVNVPNQITVSADMQKVVMLPCLPGIKEAIFCKRLVAFN